MNNDTSRYSNGTLIPCPECGAECFGAEDVRAERKRDFKFQERQAMIEMPGKKCPECGTEFPL